MYRTEFIPVVTCYFELYLMFCCDPKLKFTDIAHYQQWAMQNNVRGLYISAALIAYMVGGLGSFNNHDMVLFFNYNSKKAIPLKIIEYFPEKERWW